MFDVTKPNRPLGDFQPVRPLPAPKRRTSLALGRTATRFWFLCFILMTFVYFFAPIRTNILLLGTDDSPERGAVGRTDTIILTTVVPLVPYVGMLSIPRDLWVTVPGVGEQRINTAYFFAESSQRGTGPLAATQTVRENFDVPVQYYAVVHMQGLVSAVDAVGGLDIQLDEAMGGLPAGKHHLDGLSALAFVRDRSNSDDFSRMTRAQILITATFGKALQPTHWSALPQLAFSLLEVVDTNIPFWQWPRLLFALLRSVVFGVESQTITRDMVTPVQTAAGAQVLAPDWEAIRPLLKDMFGR
jgi:polyisoprenyl-teichoic acid--peptidoglycan teichoic acid transferase